MLQKEHKKRGREMQLAHATTAILQGHMEGVEFEELLQTRGQPACRQGCMDHPQPRVHLSVLALHMWLQARPGDAVN